MQEIVSILSGNIARLRKEAGYTQDALAEKLGITFQAVSKWETGLSCPDIIFLPQLADIFGVTIDSLFGRENAVPISAPAEQETREEAPTAGSMAELPWQDDGVLRAVLYRGRRLLQESEDPRARFTFTYEGDALHIASVMDVVCKGDVAGSVTAGGGVRCADVGGDVAATGDVECGDVSGDTTAGGNLTCGDVGGNATAGGKMECGDVSGNASAGAELACGDVGGDASAAGNVECGDVSGNASAQGDLTCGDVGGAASAGGNIHCDAIDGEATAGGDIHCQECSGQMHGQREDADDVDKEKEHRFRRENGVHPREVQDIVRKALEEVRRSLDGLGKKP